MQVIARMLGQPAFDGRRLVRAQIVEHEMDVQVRRDLGLDRLQELAKLARGAADDTAR